MRGIWRDSKAVGSRTIVLLDVDDYYADPVHGRARRRESPSLRNLRCLSATGKTVWEAEFPEDSDYYYKIVSWDPLIALSFSGYRCQIDPETGKILSSEFTK